MKLCGILGVLFAGLATSGIALGQSSAPGQAEVKPSDTPEKQSARLLAPTKVKLSIKDQTVQDAVKELVKQSGSLLGVMANSDVYGRKISLETGEVTFFEALDKLCAEAGLVEKYLMRYLPWISKQSILLVSGKHREVPTCYSGAVRVRLVPLDFVGMKCKEGESLLAFGIAAEPRLTRFVIKKGPSITRAIDDQGQMLTAGETPPPAKLPESLVRIDTYPLSPPAAAVFAIPVKLGQKPAKTLKELAGSLTVEVDGPTPVLASIDNVLQAQNQSVKIEGKDEVSRMTETSMTMTLANISKMDNGDYRLNCILEAGMPRFEYGLAVSEEDRTVGVPIFASSAPLRSDGIRLVDGKGNAYKIVGQARTDAAKQLTSKAGMRVDFRADAGQGEPARLELIGNGVGGGYGGDNRRRLSLNVPFSFKDVPLP